MGEGMFAHQLRLARHKMKMAKTTVRKQIYILSVCLSVVERQWLSACSKLSAMVGVACLLLLSIKKVKQNRIKTVAVASLANGSTPFSPCVGVLMTGYARFVSSNGNFPKAILFDYNFVDFLSFYLAFYEK